MVKIDMQKRVSRPKTRAKTGGRKRGTPNRRTQHVVDLLAHLNCDPIEGLARLAKNSKTPLDVRVSCLRTLAAYSYPKPAPMKDWSMIPLSAVNQMQAAMGLIMVRHVPDRETAMRIADDWKRINIEV